MVFGRVIRGYEDVIPKIVDVPTDEKDRPKVPIVISNCGELEPRKKPAAPQPQQCKGNLFIPLLPPLVPTWLCGTDRQCFRYRVSPELVAAHVKRVGGGG